MKGPETRCGQESRRDSGALEAGEEHLEEEGTTVCVPLGRPRTDL